MEGENRLCINQSEQLLCHIRRGIEDSGETKTWPFVSEPPMWSLDQSHQELLSQWEELRPGYLYFETSIWDQAFLKSGIAVDTLFVCSTNICRTPIMCFGALELFVNKIVKILMVKQLTFSRRGRRVTEAGEWESAVSRKEPDARLLRVGRTGAAWMMGQRQWGGSENSEHS